MGSQLRVYRRRIRSVNSTKKITKAMELIAASRIVKAQPGGAGEDFWIRWFLTPRVGRKAAEMRTTGRVTLAYQHDSGNAYVALSGAAELTDDRAEVDCRFRGSAYDDPQGITAGCILLPKRFFKKRRVRTLVYEFIATSKSLPQRYWERPKEMRYFDDSVYGARNEDRSWVVNAMMIGRLGDNLVSRIAVGVIHEHAWGSAASCCAPKLVKLGTQGSWGSKHGAEMQLTWEVL